MQQYGMMHRFIVRVCEKNTYYGTSSSGMYHLSYEECRSDSTANVRFITPNDAGYTVKKQLGKGNQASAWFGIDREGNERCIKVSILHQQPPIITMKKYQQH
eukprot:2849652-Amphidinium_carterae.1